MNECNCKWNLKDDQVDCIYPECLNKEHIYMVKQELYSLIGLYGQECIFAMKEILKEENEI